MEKMKKLLIGLLFAGILSNAIFAEPIEVQYIDTEYLEFEGNSLADFEPNLDCWPNCNALDNFEDDNYFLICGQVPPAIYEVQLSYGNAGAFTDPNLNRVQNFDLTDPSVVNSKNFYVNLINGNFTFRNWISTVVVTCDPFVSEIREDCILPVRVNRIIDGNNYICPTYSNCFLRVLPIGTFPSLRIAAFNISWDYDENLDAGVYHAMGKINVTVDGCCGYNQNHNQNQNQHRNGQ
jgi:hypothetical protein